MLDFIKISKRTRKGIIEIYPKFIIKKSDDLMIRGGDFYAIWVEDKGMWSTNEQDAIDLIDTLLMEEYKKATSGENAGYSVAYLWDAESGIIDVWHKYCQRQLRDNFHPLDETLMFSNTSIKKENYSSKKLSYPLEKGSIDSYEKIISTLYSETERHKIEWCIGSIVTGDSKTLQKFAVLYGSRGTGKSTIINIIEQLFEGYCTVFDAKKLGNSNSTFALEAFASNPLVAIQHDGDLSKIEDNTRLNSLVSHEKMTVDEKYKSTYSSRFKAFLFMGTNKPVKITDAKSGILRRLIDISPTGNKIPRKEYDQLVERVKFELSGIAYHCMEVYLDDATYYEEYQPIEMMGATNDTFNFVEDNFITFKKANKISLNNAWELYKTYCEEARIQYPLSKRQFKEELKNYFYQFDERGTLDDGTIVRSLYSNFKTNDINFEPEKKPGVEISENVLVLDSDVSYFDTYCSECRAQYASVGGTPSAKWVKVKTSLKALDTSRLHYVQLPKNHIVIDFDIKVNGKKSLEANLKAAAKWPKTYAEISQSGCAVHLHYIYTGDPTLLSSIYEDGIEVKVFTGDSSLRRKFTKCNNEPIASISSGLPLKGDKKMVNFDAINSENAIRTIIKRNLNKEYHPYTTPSINFIAKTLEDAYNSGMKYDVSDMRGAVLLFAMNSSNQKERNMTEVNKMKFKSEDDIKPVNIDVAETLPPIVFYDCEVFPNLLLICWKYQGENKTIVSMVNPSPEDIKTLVKFRLIGFNCRRYDNHILYARMQGYSIYDVYQVSRRIIGKAPNCFFGGAYNLSYTDIFDFASKKQGLKKWEIELGIHHMELGLPWDQPVPEELWPKVMKYCENDVISTETTFNHLAGDWAARQIIASIAKGIPNDTTNSLSAKFIFGDDRNPQSQFNYRFLGCDENLVGVDKPIMISKVKDHQISYPQYTVFDGCSQNDYACLFPGYKFESGKSTYREQLVGEGGFVFAKEGVYVEIDLLDIMSMHPSTIIAEQLFGKLYTKRFQDIRDARVAIKHKDYESAKQMLDGALVDYILELENGTAWYTAADLAQALKIVINAIYGLTAAKFDNKFKDRRNIDNIVAKRGALFMINLMYEVEAKGYTVAHIKTDSIKIPDASPELIDFVMEYGRLYGYEFEHEATYERMCLINKAVYICKYDGEWHATGDQFAEPYVFKTLFSKEPIEFDDLCQTKQVSDTAIYLDMNEALSNDDELQNRKKKLETKLKKIKDGSLLDTSGIEYEAIIKELTELEEKIEKCHCYHFVGKVGSFCPMKPGVGAGALLRKVSSKDGKISYSAVEGTKGYLWMESEMVVRLGLKDFIDMSYYEDLAKKAKEAINNYCDFDTFVNGTVEEVRAAILPF